MNWQRTFSGGKWCAPENEEVWTKIDDDEHGERNVFKLTRQGNLWFTKTDGTGMYVYYTPTHWCRS